MLLIADTGAIISLILVKEFTILEKLFPNYVIPEAVWEELTKHNAIKNHSDELHILSKKIKSVKNYFPLSGIDKGETEAIILYKELNADFLLIDDKRARQTAESIEINCIGTLAILYKAKEKGLISELRPIFHKFKEIKRFYSKKYLNFNLSPRTSAKLQTQILS